MRFENNSLLDKFLTNPYENEFFCVLADLVSLSYGVKVCVYSLSDVSWEELNCCYYANGNDKVLEVFMMSGGVFFGLDKVFWGGDREIREMGEKNEERIWMEVDRVNFFFFWWFLMVF